MARRPEGAGTTGAAPASGAGEDDGEAGGAPDGRTDGVGDDESDDVAEGVAVGEAGVEATMVAGRGGDGSAATRMPQPASSVAAPAAASMLARNLGLNVSLL